MCLVLGLVRPAATLAPPNGDGSKQSEWSGINSPAHSGLNSHRHLTSSCKPLTLTPWKVLLAFFFPPQVNVINSAVCSVDWPSSPQSECLCKAHLCSPFHSLSLRLFLAQHTHKPTSARASLFSNFYSRSPLLSEASFRDFSARSHSATKTRGPSSRVSGRRATCRGPSGCVA